MTNHPQWRSFIQCWFYTATLGSESVAIPMNGKNKILRHSSDLQSS